MLNFKTAVLLQHVHTYTMEQEREREPSKSNVGDTRCLECLRGHVQPAVLIIQPAVLIIQPAVLIIQPAVLIIQAVLILPDVLTVNDNDCMYT